MIDYQRFCARRKLFESLIPCHKKKTSNPLRLLVFLCISTLSGVLGILRMRNILRIRVSEIAPAEYKMLTKNAN